MDDDDSEMRGVTTTKRTRGGERAWANKAPTDQRARKGKEGGASGLRYPKLDSETQAKLARDRALESGACLLLLARQPSSRRRLRSASPCRQLCSVGR